MVCAGIFHELAELTFCKEQPKTSVRQDLESLVHKVARGWAKLSAIQKRRALRRLIQQLLISREGLDIYYYSSACAETVPLGALSKEKESPAKVIALAAQGTKFRDSTSDSKSSIHNCTSAGMVSQPEYGTNTRYLVDFIRICLSAKLLNSEEIRELYENKLLSAAQIGKHFRVSRVTILSHLHEMGIRDRPSVERATNPENYRMRVAPYGYAIQNGKLVSNKTELKICRLVVELVQRHGRRHTDVARELSRRGYKNRAGRKKWNSGTVFNIYKRWKDKL